MVYWLLAGAALSFAGIRVVSKFASAHLSPLVGAFSMTSFAALLSLSFLLYQWQQEGVETIKYSYRGLLIAALAGIGISLIHILYYTLFSKGVPVGVVSTAVTVGGLVLVSIIGIFLFKEPVSVPKLLGFAFSFAGIYLLLKK